MVLIIRNCRILSSRHRKQARTGELKDCERSCRLQNIHYTKNDKRMSLQTVLSTMLLYSIAMFTLPFGAFFSVRHYMRVEIQTDIFTTNCVSVLAAVITVNIIISCYAYQALHEAVEEKENEDENRVESTESLNKKDL